jgi:CDP-4-dehydro-6-deoxyglucose reductase
VQAKLIEWEEIAPGVRHFVFEAPQMARLDFIPGQFVSLTDSVESREITRAYSIASAPGEGNRFELCLNRVDDGAFSPHLFDLSPGDAVEMQPPLGTFTLRQPLRDSLLIATGTGIAPFRSMLKSRSSQIRLPSRCCSACAMNRICCIARNSQRWSRNSRNFISGRR